MNNLNPTQYLNEDFQRRKVKNPRYSLRAYAKALDLNPGTLSQILAGKRTITKELLWDLHSRLKFPEDIYDVWLNQIAPPRTAQKNDHVLDEAEIETLNSWMYFAVIELFSIKKSWTPEEVAKKIGVSSFEIGRIADVLIKNSILRLNSKNELECLKQSLTTFPVTKTSTQLKDLQKQMLEKAIEHLYSVDISLRHNSTLTVAVSMEDIPLIREKILKFRKEINQICSRSKKDPTQVYNMSVALYPITQIKES
ncbi:DUF4423 domain-containing protein [Bdellovibrio svalbardensis]|uniref:DUF4423 domain-containing protein n=1 Tax=Bdellovibrio svalbardensis TaxID=2972972 RepID=A0ABT6DLU0_9BACT|nr:DUF4423 domain-containing protein [Bdellovibrio svalbardensis]MDG0817844.1 DUF4423 domain-containing protein [Bdellovibrio svalbardensis]